MFIPQTGGAQFSISDCLRPMPRLTIWVGRARTWQTKRLRTMLSVLVISVEPWIGTVVATSSLWLTTNHVVITTRAKPPAKPFLGAYRHRARLVAPQSKNAHRSYSCHGCDW